MDNSEPRHEQGCVWGDADGTRWPIPVDAGWMLRYGTSEQVIAWRMSFASIVSAYSALIDPTCSQADAIARLRRARTVARSVAEERP